jgi:hypothetical protein
MPTFRGLKELLLLCTSQQIGAVARGRLARANNKDLANLVGDDDRVRLSCIQCVFTLNRHAEAGYDADTISTLHLCARTINLLPSDKCDKS